MPCLSKFFCHLKDFIFSFLEFYTSGRNPHPPWASCQRWHGKFSGGGANFLFQVYPMLVDQKKGHYFFKKPHSIWCKFQKFASLGSNHRVYPCIAFFLHPGRPWTPKLQTCLGSGGAHPPRPGLPHDRVARSTALSSIVLL